MLNRISCRFTCLHLSMPFPIYFNVYSVLFFCLSTLDLNLDFLYLPVFLHLRSLFSRSLLYGFPDLDHNLAIPHQPSHAVIASFFFATAITMSGNDLFCSVYSTTPCL